MRPFPFVACGSHVCDPYTPSGKAVSRRRHTGIAGFFNNPSPVGFYPKNSINFDKFTGFIDKFQTI